ncbi:MAG: DUF1540 domain-containing protein [Clostridiales bacterium]|nr:DUF1540 domain-containing protein [Candidatus Coliplasma equi]
MDGISFNNVPKHIGEVSCSVTNCAYHDGVHYCTAPRIAVGPSTATNCSQTVCATFKPKQF